MADPLNPPGERVQLAKLTIRRGSGRLAHVNFIVDTEGQVWRVKNTTHGYPTAQLDRRLDAPLQAEEP